MSENQADEPLQKGQESKAEDGERKGSTPYIKINVKAMDGTEVHFKLKKATALQKLINNYCMKMGVPNSSYRFMFEGVRIDPEKTPVDYQMEDDDIIDVFCEQQGGEEGGDVAHRTSHPSRVASILLSHCLSSSRNN